MFGTDGRVRRDGPHGRIGSPVKRLPNQPTPCASCPKIPEGKEAKPENAVELTKSNEEAFEHYLECKAVNRWPDDPTGIVQRDAMLCREAEETIAESKQDVSVARLAMLASLMRTQPNTKRRIP